MANTRPGTVLMADDAGFEESISSKPFVFVIGLERKEYHLHKHMIAKLSPALNILVNGKMREAEEGRVEWPDLDVETFVRFAKFVYSADYDEAEPVLSNAPPASPTRPEWATATEGLLRVMEFSGTFSRDICRDSYDWVTSDDSMDSSGSDSDSSDDSDFDSTDDDTTSDISDLRFSRSYKDSSALERSREREELRGLSMSQWMALYDLWLHTGCPRHWCGGQSKHAQIHDHTREYILHDCAVPPREQYAWKRTDEMMKDFTYCPSDDQYSKQQATAWSLATKRAENYNPDMSYLPVFLTHVRLYILADKYDVEELRRLSLYRLRLLLRGVILFRKRIFDLVAVVDEIFANTVEGDGAREVIVKYFACYIGVIRDTPEVTELLRDGGDFAVALVERMARCL
ncbi:uncharacterized protein FTOL_10678 [Fusarium torulosum]|uniref:BTB domain-containing protein n=1 Tax=Fusarium torulosum TaxID=33205 RepID=A0AAE8SMJ1_9HYPO|nr:uncharacterized protein FTOL_10678 [Fusarium torulosum]